MAAKGRKAKNITKLDELLARSLITKFDDLWASKIGISLVSKSVRLGDNTVSYTHKGKQIRLTYHNQTDLHENFAMLYENFKMEQYRDLDVRGKIVVDIGAAIGDTAIYFALNGAKHVYAFEPYPYTYKKALENIKLNGLEEKITVLNEGLGSKPGSMHLGSGMAQGGSKISETRNGRPIRITTIEKVLERFGIKSAVLKMDCEGYEYDLLLNTPKASQVGALKKFEQIAIEYHYGYVDLKEKLEGLGFGTTHSMPRLIFFDRRMRVGMLVAKRRQ